MREKIIIILLTIMLTSAPKLMFGQRAFVITTTGYGQVEKLLTSAGNERIDSLVINGYMDAVDFAAVRKYVKAHNMSVLNLESVLLKDSKVPDYALSNKNNDAARLKISRVMLPDGIAEIGEGAFANMDLVRINIPQSIRNIGTKAFANDNKLSCDIEIPEGIEEIKASTFAICTSLKMPKLPSTLKRIEAEAFSGVGHDEITFPDGIEYIGDGAFYGNSFTSVKLPEQCSQYGVGVFESSLYISEISFPDIMENIPADMFLHCHQLTKVRLPKNCKEVRSCAFLMCDRLESVELNEGLETIYNGAFQTESGKITELCLPSTVKTLWDSCFDSPGLHTVYVKAEEPPVCMRDIDDYEFSGAPFGSKSGMTLYVPVGTKEKYSNAWGWNVFDEILETDKFPSAGVTLTNLDYNDDNDNVYDLYGRKVAKPVPGHIYIRKGVKIYY